MEANPSQADNEKKEAIPSRAYLKIQLPSVFIFQDSAELSIVGFRFDPNRRLSSTK